MSIVKKTIVCLMGPTATGKTKLAIDLLESFPFSIISVDSGMVYRGMDIGTAKPTLAERKVAPHKLIDIRDPSEIYSAAQFRRDAIREIESILKEGKIPLLVGGTMLYFKVLCQGISPLPKADSAIRAELAFEAKRYGWQKLHEKLRQVDPFTAARLSMQDSQRIQRALEVYQLTGKPISQLCAENPPHALPYRFINIAIAPSLRSILHERIAKRLQLMLQQGFIGEVENLFERGKKGELSLDLPSMRTVGYRQIWQYLEGEIDYDMMQQKILAATRRLAKHQLTWLRGWGGDIHWLDSEGLSREVFMAQIRGQMTDDRGQMTDVICPLPPASV